MPVVVNKAIPIFSCYISAFLFAATVNIGGKKKKRDIVSCVCGCV